MLYVFTNLYRACRCALADARLPRYPLVLLLMLFICVNVSIAHAQGTWTANYAVTDPNGNINPPAPYNNGYFTCTPSGSVAQTYPASLTGATPPPVWLNSAVYPVDQDILNQSWFGFNPSTGTANSPYPLPSFGINVRAANSGITPSSGIFSFTGDPGDVSVHAQSDLSIYLKWDPIYHYYLHNVRRSTDLLSMTASLLATAPPPPSPPSEAGLRVTVGAIVTANMFQDDYGGYPYLWSYNGTGTATLTDSLGTSLSTTATDSQRSNSSVINRVTSLIQVGGGQRINKTVHVTLSAAAVAPTDGHTPPFYGLVATAAASETLQAGFDPRYTSISSPTIELSYQRGVPVSAKPSDGYTKVPDITDSNANEKSVDSAVFFDTARSEFGAYATFVDNANQFSNPTYVWNMSGDGTSLGTPMTPSTPSTAGGSQSVHITFIGGQSQATGYPKHTTFTASATDGVDGCQETATYNVTWHLPTEWPNSSYIAGTPFWQSEDPSNTDSPYAIDGGDLGGIWSSTDTLLIDAASMFTNVAGSMVPSPYWAGFLAAASIAFSQTQPITDHEYANFEQAFTNSNSLFPNGPPADYTRDTMQLYYMTTPVKQFQYEPRFYYGDAYNANGYSGVAFQQDAKIIAGTFSGTFYLFAPK